MCLYRLWDKFNYCKYNLILIFTRIRNPIPSLARKFLCQFNYQSKINYLNVSVYTQHFLAYIDTHELCNFKSHVSAHILLKYYYIFLAVLEFLFP
jgi:hypothetical protein